MNLSLLRLSPTARYALCGMTYMARQPAGRYALADDIAEAEKLPRHFLAKILQELALGKMLLSRRGPGGGYALAQEPKNIHLLDVLAFLQEAPNNGFCFLEDRSCDSQGPCAMHEAAIAAGQVLLKALQRMTLADLLDERQNGRSRHA